MTLEKIVEHYGYESGAWRSWAAKGHFYDLQKAVRMVSCDLANEVQVCDLANRKFRAVLEYDPEFSVVLYHVEADGYCSITATPD